MSAHGTLPDGLAALRDGRDGSRPLTVDPTVEQAAGLAAHFGYVLVPAEPTRDMLERCESIDGWEMTENDATEVWRDMVAIGRVRPK